MMTLLDAYDRVLREIEDFQGKILVNAHQGNS